MGIIAEGDFEIGGTVWDADGSEELDAAEVSGSPDLHVRGLPCQERRVHRGGALKAMTVAEPSLAHDLSKETVRAKRLVLEDTY
ncbi:hypothetical protein [Ruania halotolerans]|uniref:hypothetical protein n=1 Tax=Ruania halotolerans TaxID=2897773 RepID=UPI001E2B3756|nr:hypothetical protein [Ruania halotolerans]UFU05983.1 hypothetical protein LQF10_16390 [Ruania halotolerans]